MSRDYSSAQKSDSNKCVKTFYNNNVINNSYPALDNSLITLHTLFNLVLTKAMK